MDAYITEREQQIARDLVKANAINMCWKVAEVSFSHDIAEYHLKKP